MEDPRAQIRTFLAKSFRNIELQDNQDIFSSGFINSLFAMQLVLFVESEFHISIENEDLDIANFNTIDSIASLIERKTTIHPDTSPG